MKSRKQRSPSRKTAGTALALVVASVFIIVCLIVAAFKIYSYLGGSQEFKNSVDAATLAEAAHATELKISPGDTIYKDVGDSAGLIGLMNINRVFGKAYLINANAQMMIQEYYEDIKHRPVEKAASASFEQAITLSHQLAQKISAPGALNSYFQNMAQNKPVKLLGQSVSVDRNASTATTYMYAGEESNIMLIDPEAIALPKQPPTCSAENIPFIQGYIPVTADGKTCTFTTFHANEAPHLIAASTFAQAQKTGLGTGSTNNTFLIPNAFKDSGKLEGNLSLATSAFAVANPMRSYHLTIPHSYVTIRLEPALATIKVEGMTTDVASYGPKQGKTSLVEAPFASHQGFLVGYSNLGNEYRPSNRLWDAIVSIQGGKAVLETLILQRIKEFAPTYSMEKLQKILQTNAGSSEIPYEPLRQVKPHTWYIYPEYSTPDQSDVPNVKVACPDFNPLPPWLQPLASAEGTAKAKAGSANKLNMPNWSWSVLIGAQYASDYNYCLNGGSIMWKPGTGASQNLGGIDVSHSTQIIFTGEPQPPEGSGSESGPPPPPSGSGGQK